MRRIHYFVGVMETISVFLTIFIANKRVKRSEELLIYIVLFELLFIAALIDLKQSIIPNTIIVSGLILWIIAVSLRVIIGRKTFWNVHKPSLIGGAVVSGILLIIALIVKTALGMGDVKLFFVLGLLLGLSNTYLLLLVTVVIMALISIVLLIIKKVNRKTMIPMAPFVVVGYILNDPPKMVHRSTKETKV